MSTSSSQARKPVSPENVKRDNTDLFRHSVTLDRALRKERFSKAKPEAFIDYCDAAGLLDFESPFDEIDFQLDLETFKKSLDAVDAQILGLFLLGLRQAEVAERVNKSQPTVSNRLRKIKERFKEFYME